MLRAGSVRRWRAKASTTPARTRPFVSVCKLRLPAKLSLVHTGHEKTPTNPLNAWLASRAFEGQRSSLSPPPADPWTRQLDPDCTRGRKWTFVTGRCGPVTFLSAKAFMDAQLLAICLLTAGINLIGTLAYDARVSRPAWQSGGGRDAPRRYRQAPRAPRRPATGSRSCRSRRAPVRRGMG